MSTLSDEKYKNAECLPIVVKRVKIQNVYLSGEKYKNAECLP